MTMEKYGVEDRRKLISEELEVVKKKLSELDKTASADTIRQLNERMHELVDALGMVDSRDS